MSWSRTQEHHIDLPAEQLWQIVGDPSRLPCWSPAVSRLPETVDRNASERTITCRSPLVGGTLLVSWTLSGSGGGTLLTQRVTVQGPYPSLAAGRLARPHVSGFAENCARLFTQSGGAPNAPKVVIAGGSGFLGRQLAADLACRGHEVVILTRRSDPALPFRQSVWDGRTVGAWASELTGDGTALVNLAGKLVDCPPTQANIADLRSSRVDATRALVEASKALRAPLARWLQASTTAVFGDAGEARLTEHSAIPASPREGALPQMTGVAQPWEAAVEGANAAHVTILRTSIVLEQDCPAFERLSLLANSGLGGPVGGGEQWFSWIHLADWLRIARGALGIEAGVDLASGVVCAAAPAPVRNRELMAILRKHLAPGPLKRWSIPTPSPVLRLGAALLRTDPALARTGRHVTSVVLEGAGLRFSYPDLDSAVADITT